MSKEEHAACKVSSACKGGKERKPKKPHYIPRPWGKPYNYKCFQCPFTCMEKSHLYNHMKYSLCKNSLSLLIESDWPYKKGNLLHHPEQLRLRPGLGPPPRSPAKERPERGSPPGESPRGGPESPEGEEGRGEGEEGGGAADEGADAGPGARPRGAARREEAELVMADVFSLEEQLLRARSVEAKLRHYKLARPCSAGPGGPGAPKPCLSGPALLSEQWRLLGAAQKPKAEPLAGGEHAALPCYPPPPAPAAGLPDCPTDHPGLNLSLLGVSYPLSPGLFSYLNPHTHTHAQLAPLPFLASAAAQLAHTDRALLPPRLYYPFLCEHAFGATSPPSAPVDSPKAAKTPPATSLDPPTLLGLPTPAKLGLWRVPALRPASGPAYAGAWGSPARASPEPGPRTGERLQGREGPSGWLRPGPEGREQGPKRTAAPLEAPESPAEKKPALGFNPLDLLKNIHRATPTAAMATDKLLLHSSLQAVAQAGSLDEWYTDLRRAASESPPGETVSPRRGREPAEERERERERDADSAAALLRDLSAALQEYQSAERRAAMLTREQLPAQQRHLWAHLGKIRAELSHIQQALERTARHSEGPLDLSVKKDPAGTTATAEGAALQGIMGETAKDELSTETEDEEEEEEEGEGEEEEEAGSEMKERRKRSLDALIKLNMTAVAMVKSEVPSSPGGIRGSAEALWHGRTTKCEADSSVLLCPKRPPSLLCPPSPLNTTDA